MGRGGQQKSRSVSYTHLDVYKRQENRLHSQKAIMLELMKGEFVKLPGLVELQELAHI